MDLSTTPIKMSFHLAWNFFTKNKMLSLFIVLAIFGMGLLSLIPILGLIFYIVLMGMVFSMQVSIGKSIYAADSLEAYYKSVKNANIKDVLLGNLSVAFGYLVGFFVLEIAVIIILVILAMLLGAGAQIDAIMQGVEPSDLGGLGLVMFLGSLFVMFIGYIFPIVVGRVYEQDNFGGAFKTVFTMFSVSTWKAGLNLNYFLLVVVWMISIFFIAMLASLTFATVILIPLGLFMFYFLALLSTSVCAVGKEITMGSEATTPMVEATPASSDD